MGDVQKCKYCNTWHMGGPCPPKYGTPEWYKQHPIFGVDFTNDNPVELIEGVRSKIAHARGQLSDIGHVYQGFKERIQNVEGALTCCLVTLHDIMQEMKKLKE